MPTRAPYPSEGGDDERGAAAGSREALAEAMLQACGELGFERVAVADVVERGGGEPSDFYRHFADLAECYAAAYEVETGKLCGEILARGAAAEDWRGGLHAAVAFLAEFLRTEPGRARALLIDVHLAGERAEQRRKDVSERLAHAIDSAREEPESHYSPPPLTSLFMVSAIEAAACSALVRDRPESFAEAAPELEQLVITAYFGD
jgi:AcrR family transcriptional regulator